MRPGGSAAALAAVVFVAAACASGQPSPAATSSAPLPAPPTMPATPSATAPTDPLPSPGAVAPIDPTLLEVLPDDVAGLPVQPAPDALGEAVSDPAIVRTAQALAAAIAVDPATGEFTYATVVRFFGGVMNDAFYRDWRDTFDAGVCEPAGGVSGTAEAAIGGRQVFIGSCAGGVRTYHAWLGNHGVLVSVSAFGAQRLGERIVEALRD